MYLSGGLEERANRKVHFSEYGACIMHALACEGKLDNRMKGESMKRPRIVTCDKCVIMVINGIVCHELGCPNAKKKAK